MSAPLFCEILLKTVSPLSPKKTDSPLSPKRTDSPLTPLQTGLSPNPSAREGNSYNRKKGT